jgi:hypothetical protein
VIDRAELLRFADELGLEARVVEKDYVLGWVLAGIFRDPLFANSWVFKGGTCLKKAIEVVRFAGANRLCVDLADSGTRKVSGAAPGRAEITHSRDEARRQRGEEAEQRETALSCCHRLPPARGSDAIMPGKRRSSDFLPRSSRALREWQQAGGDQRDRAAQKGLCPSRIPKTAQRSASEVLDHR